MVRPVVGGGGPPKNANAVRRATIIAAHHPQGGTDENGSPAVTVDGLGQVSGQEGTALRVVGVWRSVLCMAHTVIEKVELEQVGGADVVVATGE
jgi:hypothetical protein